MFAEDCSFLSVFFAFMKRVVWEVEVFLYISFNFFYFKCAIDIILKEEKKIEMCIEGDSSII